jgi:glycosyltransferase 2 family protein
VSGAPATRERLRALLGWLFALACLAWIFHDLDPARLGRSLRGLRWGWVAPAVAADILSYCCQGARWSLLLRPLGPVSPLRATRAIYAGLFVNELLPLRVGEVVRSYLVSRWTGAAITRVVPSIAVERLFDGFWLSVAFALAAIAVRLPRDLARAADVMGALVLAGAALLAFVALRRPRAGAATDGPAAPPAAHGRRGRLRRLAGRFLRELRDMARAPGFPAAALVSAGVLVGQALAFWLVMIACGLPLSPWAGAITLIIVHLGTALPNAPGNIGSYQFFCVVGLALFGIGKAEATAFSLVAFALLTVPLWALGFFALRGCGLSIGRVRREAGGWLRR